MPRPGSGCHTYILGTANLGVLCGLSIEKIFVDIRRSIPSGSRQIPDKEILDAIRKAEGDHGRGQSCVYVPKLEPVVEDGMAAFQWIISQATITDEADLWEHSPIRINWPPQEDVRHAL